MQTAVVSGISSQDALLATAAYRLVSLWVPILCGVPAWILHRRRYKGGITTNLPT